MYLDVSSTSHGSKDYVMTEKKDNDSSTTLSPDHYITQVANNSSELKLMSSQKEISRPSKKGLRPKIHLGSDEQGSDFITQPTSTDIPRNLRPR